MPNQILQAIASFFGDAGEALNKRTQEAREEDLRHRAFAGDPDAVTRFLYRAAMAGDVDDCERGLAACFFDQKQVDAVLATATTANQRAIARLALRRGVTHEGLDRAFEAAIGDGNEGLAFLFLDHGVDRSNPRPSFLRSAIFGGHAGTANVLLEHTATPADSSYLAMSLPQGNAETTYALVRHGARLESADLGEVPLEPDAVALYHQVRKAVANHEPPPENPSEMRPRSAAANNDPLGPAMMDAMVKGRVRDAQKYAPHIQSATALQALSYYGAIDNDQLIAMIISRIDRMPTGLHPSVATAAARDDVAVFGKLLSKGADPHAGGEIALRAAIRNGAEKTTQQILTMGGDPNACGGEPLANAIVYGTGRPLVSAVLAAGGDPNATGGRYAAENVKNCRQQVRGALGLDECAAVYPASLAIAVRSEDALKMLLEHPDVSKAAVDQASSLARCIDATAQRGSDTFARRAIEKLEDAGGRFGGFGVPIGA